jgi:hypothetical protein
MGITSELDVKIRKLVLQKRRGEALALVKSFGFEDPEIQVRAVEARIAEQRAADNQKFVDYARRKGLGPYAAG